MSYYFNAEEIFEVGAQIERNGKAFYEAAAETAQDAAVAALCRELAAWEQRHVELFESLKRSLPEEARQGSAFDPGQELADYVKGVADTHVFLKNQDPRTLAQSCQSAQDLLDAALTFEKDSVVFYAAMKKIVPKHQAQDSVDALIDEELKHIQILSRQRNSLGAGPKG